MIDGNTLGKRANPRAGECDVFVVLDKRINRVTALSRRQLCLLHLTTDMRLQEPVLRAVFAQIGCRVVIIGILPIVSVSGQRRECDVRNTSRFVLGN